MAVGVSPTDKRRILHVDLDAFYASVEQRDDPTLRGRPVIVGGMPRSRGVVAAASYEARAYGVRAAMPARMAYRLCEQAVFLRPDFAKYAAVSRQVMAILSGFTPDVEPVSLDEAFLDVTGCEGLWGTAEDIARRIKERVREECGLTISVGVATGKAVAKVASDLRKPDGLVVVPPGRERAFLAPLPVRVLWGVGEKTAQRLELYGVRTIGELAALPRETLERHFGEGGRRLYRLARGMDDSPVRPAGRAKSVSKERTFEKDIDDPVQARRELAVLAEEVARGLRARGLRGRVVGLKVRYPDFHTITRQTTLALYTDSPRILRERACYLFDRELRPKVRFRLLGVSLSGFAPPQAEQLAFCPPSELRAQAVDRLVDTLQRRFGKESIYRGVHLVRCQ